MRPSLTAPPAVDDAPRWPGTAVVVEPESEGPAVDVDGQPGTWPRAERHGGLGAPPRKSARICRDPCEDHARISAASRTHSHAEISARIGHGRRCFEGLFDEGVDHPLLEGADFCGRESGDVAQPDAGLDATCGAECQREPVEALLADRLGDGRERLEEPRNDAALAQRQLVRHLAQREPQHRTLLRLILLHEADDEPGNGGHAFVQRFRRRVGKDRRGSCLRVMPRREVRPVTRSSGRRWGERSRQPRRPPRHGACRPR